jgi:di/tricarboxylate transporter
VSSGLGEQGDQLPEPPADQTSDQDFGPQFVAAPDDEPLAPGDSLLVVGSWHAIERLQSDTRDFVVLTLPEELEAVAPARQRAPVALFIMLGMVLLSAFEVMPVVAAVMLAALAAVFTGCLSMEDGYRAISWSSLVLIAGMLPIADALESTGGVDLMVEALVGGLGNAGPYVLMTVFFALTAGLSLVLSNTATAVLVAPIALRAAVVLDVSPYPLAMAVAIAASAAFVTPVSTPVVTLVVAPGNYKFLDFVKVGLPLLVLTWAITLLVTPIFFPF